MASFVEAHEAFQANITLRGVVHIVDLDQYTKDHLTLHRPHIDGRVVCWVSDLHTKGHETPYGAYYSFKLEVEDHKLSIICSGWTKTLSLNQPLPLLNNRICHLTLTSRQYEG